MPALPRVRLRTLPPPRGRVVLALEELEGREVLSPVAVAPFLPAPPQTPEGVSIGLVGGPSSGTSFGAFDPVQLAQPYTADLAATRGVLDVDAMLAGSFGVTVAYNGTARVTLTGDLSDIDSFLVTGGYTFTPDPFFSGDATLSLTVVDPTAVLDGYAEYPVQVLPVAQVPSAALTFAPPFFVGPGPVVIPAGAIVVNPWADTDGSEVTQVLLTAFGPGVDPTQFTLTAGGAVVPLDPDQQWVVASADQATLTALLNDLVLTPPAGFSGSFALGVVILAEDTAVFPSTADITADTATLPPAVIPYRYFQGNAVLTAARVDGNENQPVGVNGAIYLDAIADNQPGDTYALTLTAPAGAFFVDLSSSNYRGTVTGNGTGTLTFGGDLIDLDEALNFLPLTYAPPPRFSGEVPYAVVLQSFRPDPGQGVYEYPAPVVANAVVRVAPVASFPPVFPNFEEAPLVPVGPGASPVPGDLFGVFPTPDADGSETFTLVVDVVGGATPGFVLTAGGNAVPRESDGTWVLTAPTAAGLQNLIDTLTLTPAGGLTGFGYSLRITAVVSDAADYPSDLTGAVDTNVDVLPLIPLRLYAGGFGVTVTGVVIDEGQVGDLGGNVVQVIDPDSIPGDTYELTLTLGDPGATFVRLFPQAPPLGVFVSGFGTNTLVVTGRATGLAGLFGPTGMIGFAAASPYTSGTIPIAAAVVAFRSAGQQGFTPQAGEFGGSATAVVQPVVSPAGINPRGTREVFAPSAPFAPGAGFFTVSPWADADGSEAGVVVLTLAGTPAAAGFTLDVNGVPVAPSGPGQWTLTGGSAGALQAQLDTLTFTPPPGFTGRVALLAGFTLTDTAAGIPGPYRAVDTRTTQAVTPLRFFAAGANVGPPIVIGAEGQPIDLGGQLNAFDPNGLPGDTHTLALSVPTGALTANPAAVPQNLTLTVVDAQTITLDGTLPDIMAFLAAAGSLTFDPQDAAFSGLVPLAYTLTQHPLVDPRGFGPPNTFAPSPAEGAVLLALAPVASALNPLAPDVTTDADVPVALAVTVPGLADLGPTETYTLQLLGVPPGALLNHGADTGGGAWSLTLADLDGLTFTPPPGFAGMIPLTVLVTVTDANPELETSSTAIGTKVFTVTVNAPADAPPPPPPPRVGTPPAPPPDDTPLDPPGDEAPQPGPTDDGPDPTDDTPTDESFSPPPDFDDGDTGGEFADFTDDGGDLDGVNDFGGAGGSFEGDTEPTPEAERSRADTGTVYGPGSDGHDRGGYGAQQGPRPDGGAPSTGSLFSRADPPPPPLAATADRHPLPPVLPLDQSTPVAGFTDSGGDSLALIDAVYRDAAATPAAAAVTIPVVFTPAARGDDATPVAVAAAAGAGPGGPVALAAGDGDPAPEPGGWSFDWLAAGLGFAAAGWFASSRGLGRWLVRRLPRFLARRFPQTQELA